MLARAIEAAGISTIFVTMVPYWAERRGVPRTLGVEFPFGHTLGNAGAAGQQLRVIRRALEVLRDAKEPGSIEHFDEVWEGDEREWRRRWQPDETVSNHSLPAGASATAGTGAQRAGTEFLMALRATLVEALLTLLSLKEHPMLN